MTNDSDAVTFIQRVAAGDFSGYNGAVKAAQEWLTARTAASLGSRRAFNENEDDSQRLSGFRGYMS